MSHTRLPTHRNPAPPQPHQLVFLRETGETFTCVIISIGFPMHSTSSMQNPARSATSWSGRRTRGLMGLPASLDKWPGFPPQATYPNNLKHVAGRTDLNPGLLFPKNSFEALGAFAGNASNRRNVPDTPSTVSPVFRKPKTPPPCSRTHRRLWYTGRRRRDPTQLQYVGLRGPKPGKIFGPLLGNGIFSDDIVASRLCDGSGYFDDQRSGGVLDVGGLRMVDAILSQQYTVRGHVDREGADSIQIEYTSDIMG
ncbi:uncharacterized protein ATNIH1004_001969 [Aspergillus tanneri]|uniref:Uncharacterized protein n=1 Tax=Aspergillus tanneri TaxID=1220188 RepID=A0A5M9MEE0_9EURO|nr:uncharacterized protein ATNIH1004_001969 [Aspergillus tanneri]KAA8641367.1 hypothetical protein ATNIH1004_001969 [Aspergillus tanneri]